MPPKKGTKRKATRESATELNGDADLAPPDRDTWPGWVEMESEPAFFNVMLKEMGVRGVKMHEVYGLEEDELAVLPSVLTFCGQPIHALIFLFRYNDTDMTQLETGCSEDVWFANQIPDFSCASVALLNIVNNIEGLQMGKELRDFKDFTKDLDPMGRGDAIDGFDFLKRIHNSFARQTDLLNADMHMRKKMNKAKKRQAVTRAQATKKARKAENASENKRADSAVATPTRASDRSRKPPERMTKVAQDELHNSGSSSTLSDPPESDPEFTNAHKSKKDASSSPSEKAPRRSGRQPKPRQDPTKLVSEAETQPNEEGFHYVAYVPVNGRVWKMDGLDSYPHLVGDFDEEGGGTWMNVAGPEVQARMMMFEGGSIEFSLMAVVHDPIAAAREELAVNVKELQLIDAKLDSACKDWREKDVADLNVEEVVQGPCAQFDLGDADLDAAPPNTALDKEIERHEDDYVGELVNLRQQRVKAQAPLRASVRDQLESAKADDDRARLRRHDFGSFVKGWLGALADEEALKGLVDDAAS